MDWQAERRPRRHPGDHRQQNQSAAHVAEAALPLPRDERAIRAGVFIVTRWVANHEVVAPRIQVRFGVRTVSYVPSSPNLPLDTDTVLFEVRVEPPPDFDSNNRLIDPKAPVKSLWSSDRTKLEAAGRRRCREIGVRRQQSFACANRGTRQDHGSMAASESRELALPTQTGSLSRSTGRHEADARCVATAASMPLMLSVNSSPSTSCSPRFGCDP